MLHPRGHPSVWEYDIIRNGVCLTEAKLLGSPLAGLCFICLLFPMEKTLLACSSIIMNIDMITNEIIPSQSALTS